MFGNIHRDVCGLYYCTKAQQRHYLPQLDLASHTTLSSLSFTTHLVQTFNNPTPNTIQEARYTFPLYDGVAVIAFVCKIGTRIITGRVEQKDQARQTFQNAVEKGESAGLLESLPLGIFAVTLGNIPANATITIDTTYGGELKHDSEIDGLRFTLPMSIAPRYGKYPGELLQLQSNSPVTNRGMRITVDADMKGSTIRKIQTPSKEHPISVSIGSLSTDSAQATPQLSKASVSLTLGTVELSTDFVLQFLIDNLASPKAVLEKHPTLQNHMAFMATFVPRFNLKPSCPEIVFIADQSGSMQGSRNLSLVAALTTFLKSLPRGVRFNICRFGSRFDLLWATSQPYTSDNVATALAYAQNFRADMGGTEMYEAVKATFDKRLVDMPLEIILLTDGEIYGEKQLFDLISQKLDKENVDARVFTLGIGDQVSTTLVEGVSRVGRGFAQFVSDHEVLDSKVVRMLKAALYPHMSDCSLIPQYDDEEEDFEIVSDNTVSESRTETAAKAEPSSNPVASPEASEMKAPISLFDENFDANESLDKSTEGKYDHLPEITVPATLQAPSTNIPFFPFNRTTVFLIVESGSSKLPTSITLHAKCAQGPLELKIPVQNVGEGNTVHHLAVRKLAQELEDGRGWIMSVEVDGKPISNHSRSDEFAEREGVRVGVKYQVANRWCSFVAVEDNKVVPNRTSLEVTQPPSPFGSSNGMFSTQRTALTVNRISNPFGSAPGVSSNIQGSSQTSSTVESPARTRITNPSAARRYAAPAFAMSPTSHTGGLFGASAPAPAPASAPPPPPSGGLFGHTSLASTPLPPPPPPSSSGGLFSHTSFAPTPAPPPPPPSAGPSGSGVWAQAFAAPNPAGQPPFHSASPHPPQGFGSAGGFGSSGGHGGQAATFGHGFDGNRNNVVEEKKTDIEKVRALVHSQDFAGFWEWDKAGVVVGLLGVDKTVLEDKDVAENNVTMTALVLRFLASKMKAFEDVWEMVADKGRAWLDEQALSVEEKERLEELVGELL